MISIYAVLYGTLIFLQSGLTATIRREFAIGDDNKENNLSKFELLVSIEYIYTFLGIIIILFFTFFSHWIVENWLNVDNEHLEVTTNAIRIMGITMVFHFLATLYQGGLIGLQKQLSSNILQAIWSILNSGFVILPLLFIDATPIVFVVWQLTVTGFYCILLRFFLQKELKIPYFKRYGFKLSIIKSIWKFAGGMLVISLISSFNYQLDKIVIGNFLEIKYLGFYTIAYSLAQIPIVLSNPIAMAIHPVITKNVALKNTPTILSYVNNYSKIISILSISIGATISLYSYDLIYIWTDNLEVTLETYRPASILIIGSVLLSLQVIPFNLAIANSDTKYNIIIGILSIVVMVPLLIYLTSNYQLIGASFSWLLINLISTPTFLYIIVSKYLNTPFFKWFAKSTLIPVTIIIPGIVLFWYFKPTFESSYWNIGYAIITSGAVLVLSLAALFPRNIIKTLSQQ